MPISSRQHSWQIIVPVYNEADGLADVLEQTISLGYANKITFVNDGSTDNSGEILDEWKALGKYQVLHLVENRKKEGAIHEVLERQISLGEMPRYTILLDADSLMFSNGDNCIFRAVDEAAAQLEQNVISAMAFRIDANIPKGWAPISWCVYADYAGSQFDNWLTGRGWQLWVINGPGGIFQSDCLLGALRKIEPDFETGDLMISVALMSLGKKVGFWPQITIKTYIPKTYHAYFQQRRRWERGTIKTIWSEAGFYKSLFSDKRLLALYVIQYLLFPVGIITLPFALWISDEPLIYLVKVVSYSYLFWVLVTSVKCSLNRWIRRDGMLFRSIGWSFMNGFLFIIATGPARITGFCEAIRFCLIRWKRSTPR